MRADLNKILNDIFFGPYSIRILFIYIYKVCALRICANYEGTPKLECECLPKA